MILDYTKASFYEVDSARIVAEVQRDLTAELDLEETVSRALEGIWVTEGVGDAAK